MDSKLLAIPVVMLCLFKTLAAENKSPFEMNGWQFHEYDIPNLEESINRAPEYGVNFFIFSHRLFRSVEGFLVSGENFDPDKTPQLPHLAKLYSSSHTKPHAGWQEDLLHLGELADEQNIPYYLWIHEFDDIPEKYKVEGDRVDFDHPELFSYLEERYEKLLKVVPNTAGFVLTFHECHNKIFRNTEVKSKLDVPERIYHLTKLIYDIAKRHGKELILRSFFYEPLEMEYFKTALDRLPDDLIVMNKTTFHEFDPFYPPNAMHGNVGNKRQIIEIDLGVEKAWSNHGAYAQGEYIQRYVRRAQEKGLTGAVGRARMLWEKPFEDIHEINLYAFARFMEDPGLDVDEVYNDWTAKRYPAKAVPHIVSAIKRTQFINFHGRYHLEFWLTKSLGAQWDDYHYYFGHIMLRSRYKWTKDPVDKELETKLYYPDREFYKRAVAEKEEVLRQIRASIKDIEKARRYVSRKQYASLKEDFNFLLDAGMLAREWTRAFLAQRLYMVDPTDEHKRMVFDALAELDKLDRAPGVTYGLNRETGHRYNIDHFVLEMRWRVANRSRARAEDERFLEWVRNKMDVDKN